MTLNLQQGYHSLVVSRLSTQKSGRGSQSPQAAKPLTNADIYVGISTPPAPLACSDVLT